MMLIRPDRAVEAEREAEIDDTTFVTAREGSELASTLRANGWTARAGWRTSSDSGKSIWLVRFQRPTAPERE
jgi:hypothetical protein